MSNKFIMLFEGTSDEVFHFTDIYSLHSILEKGEIVLSTSLGTPADNKFSKNYPYFLSLSTSKSSKIGYPGSKNSNGLVRLDMNGHRLKHNYKIISADYWNYSRDPKSDFYSDISIEPESKLKYISTKDELEQRLLSKTPSLEISYINSISVRVEPKMEIGKGILYIAKKALEYGIEINFYDNETDFIYNRTENSIDLENYITNKSEYTPYVTSSNYMDILIPIILYEKNDDFIKKFTSDYIKIDKVKKFMLKNELTENDMVDRTREALVNFKKRQYRLSYLTHLNSVDEIIKDFYLLDFFPTFQAEIHNTRSNTDDIKMLVYKYLLNDMKKLQQTDLKKYLATKILLDRKEKSGQ